MRLVLNTVRIFRAHGNERDVRVEKVNICKRDFRERKKLNNYRLRKKNCDHGIENSGSIFKTSVSVLLLRTSQVDL